MKQSEGGLAPAPGAANQEERLAGKEKVTLSSRGLVGGRVNNVGLQRARCY